MFKAVRDRSWGMICVQRAILLKGKIKKVEANAACQFWLGVVVNLFEHVPKLGRASEQVVNHLFGALIDFPCLKGSSCPTSVSLRSQKIQKGSLFFFLS
jgi:hypothetical protein